MTKEYIRVIIKSDYLFITVIPFVISTKFPLYITISNIRYIETSDRIADYIFKESPRVKKGIGEIMGGQVLELESERLERLIREGCEAARVDFTGFKGTKKHRPRGNRFVRKNSAFSAPSGVRTLDTLIKSQVLYQLS